MWVAVHETTSEYTDDIIDFFEATTPASPILASDHPAMHGSGAAHENAAATAFLDGRRTTLPNVQRPNHHRRKTLRT